MRAYLLLIAALTVVTSCKKDRATTPTTINSTDTTQSPDSAINAMGIRINYTGTAIVNSDMHFTSNVTGPAMLWNFGDGTTSTDINPTHRFVKSGNLKVTVTIGQATSAPKEINIGVGLKDKIEQVRLWGRSQYEYSAFEDTTYYFSDTSFALQMKSETEVILPWGVAKFDTVYNNTAVFTLGTQYPSPPPITHSYATLYYYYADGKIMFLRSHGGRGGHSVNYYKSK
jgi:PKD repeat protein